MTDTHRSDRGQGVPAPGSAGDGTAGALAPQDAAPQDAAPPALATDSSARDVGPGWPPAQMGHRPPNPFTDDTKTPSGTVGVTRMVAIALLVALVGFRFGWSIPLVIGGIVVMIFLHELGHYLTAKWSGMKVTEFFIGFGPRIWSFRRGETEYGVKVLPAGAYVRIVGMNNLDDADPTDEARTYRHQSFPKRLLVVSAGSIMHMLQAFVLLVIALGLVGVPGGSLTGVDESDAEAWGVSQVTPDSAAQQAGLRRGDEIVAVDGQPVSSLNEDLSSVLSAYDVGDTVALTVDRDGRETTVEATLGERPADIPGGRPGSPFLGVGSGPVYDDTPIGLGPALVQAPGEMVAFMGDSVGALAGFFSPSGLGDFADNVNNAAEDAERNTSEEAAPPREGEGNRMVSILGVVRLGADMWEQGGAYAFLLLFFQINIFIGIFNMVPLPPLDGGHAAVAVYERLRSPRGLRYHADVAKLLPLTYAVVMGLVLLGVTSIYLDLVNPVNL